jgi:hypothetical protein
MKYWGKKPHNIWREYIKNYTPKGGVFLDPFCGSATSIFESLKLGITSIGFDLNPISPFIIEAITSDFDKDKFKDELNTIPFYHQYQFDNFFSLFFDHFLLFGLGFRLKFTSNGFFAFFKA